MATSTRRFAWLPREPHPQPLSDKAVQIVQILQRYPKGLSASEIVKRSGGTFLVNHVYVYLRRLQARGIVKVTSTDRASVERGQRDVLRASLAPGQIVRRSAADAKAAAAEPKARRSAAEAKAAAPEPKARRGAAGADTRRAAPAAARRGASEGRRTQSTAAGH